MTSLLLAQLTGADATRMLVPALIGIASAVVSGLLSRSRSHDDRRLEQLERRVDVLMERVYTLDKELALLRKDQDHTASHTRAG